MVVIDGFKYFYLVIIDVNVMIIFIVIVLVYFGLGLIKGFVVVLIIGVFFFLFIVVLVGCLMFDSWLQCKKDLSFSIGVIKNVFFNFDIDWLGKCCVVYIVFGILIVLSIVFFVVCGFELGVDFKGGYNYNIVFVENIDVDV